MGLSNKLNIEQAAITFYSETETYEILIWYDRPPIFTLDYVGIWAGCPAGQWPPNEGFVVRNDAFQNTLSDTFSTAYITYQPNIFLLSMPSEYTLIDAQLTIIIDANALGMTQAGRLAPMDWEIATHATTLQGVSGIDTRQIQVLEPASLAVSMIGIFCLLVAYFFRKRENNAN